MNRRRCYESELRKEEKRKAIALFEKKTTTKDKQKETQAEPKIASK